MSFPLLQNQNLTKHLSKYDPCKSPHISTEILMFRHFLFWWIHYICIICSIEGSPRWLRISTTRLTGSAFSHIIFNGANLINPIRTGHRVIHTSKAQKETKKQNTTQRVYMCFWAKMLHEVIIKSTSLHILPWFAWILGPLASLWLVIAVGMTFHTKVPELLCILTQDLSNLPGGTGGKHNDVGSKMWFHTNLKNCPSTCIICPKYEKLIVESTWMIPQKNFPEIWSCHSPPVPIFSTAGKRGHPWRKASGALHWPRRRLEAAKRSTYGSARLTC